MGSTPGISTATKLTICLFFSSVWSAKIGRHMEAEFAGSRKGQQAIIVYEIDLVYFCCCRFDSCRLHYPKPNKMTGIEILTMSCVVICIVVAYCGYRDAKNN